MPNNDDDDVEVKSLHNRVAENGKKFATNIVNFWYSDTSCGRQR